MPFQLTNRKHTTFSEMNREFHRAETEINRFLQKCNFTDRFHLFHLDHQSYEEVNREFDNAINYLNESLENKEFSLLHTDHASQDEVDREFENLELSVNKAVESCTEGGGIEFCECDPAQPETVTITADTDVDQLTRSGNCANYFPEIRNEFKFFPCGCGGLGETIAIGGVYILTFDLIESAWALSTFGIPVSPADSANASSFGALPSSGGKDECDPRGAVYELKCNVLGSDFVENNPCAGPGQGKTFTAVIS